MIESRTVVADAWTTPQILVAAPVRAFASSAYSPQVFDWDLYDVGSVFTSTRLGGTTVSLTATGNTGAAVNRTVHSGPQGGVSERYLALTLPNISYPSQTLTFTFSVPVCSVSFTILGIDASPGSWCDAVSIATPGFDYANGTSVTGTGTPADPFRSNCPTSVPATSGAGNVELYWEGPLSSVTFTYAQNSSNVIGSPVVGVSDLCFTSTPC